jgi:hypothetical protein
MSPARAGAEGITADLSAVRNEHETVEVSGLVLPCAVPVDDGKVFTDGGHQCIYAALVQGVVAVTGIEAEGRGADGCQPGSGFGVDEKYVASTGQPPHQWWHCEAERVRRQRNSDQEVDQP